ncbi:aminotransferase class IV [Terasakiella sp.]|uniref:aminotransferase class IV n=1 Tax=Terasakiella sp. TaxID=2034861 RepID=UPI003AA82F52
MIAWFNGELFPLDGIAIKATDRGFTLGDGFFETMLAQQGQVAHFDAHMARLHESAHMMDIPLPYSTDEIGKAIDDVLTACQLKDKRAALRLTVTRGSGPRGLLPPLEITPQVLLSASDVPDHFPSAKLALVTMRRNEFNPTSRIKSLNYLDNIFALREAVAKGADEALLLNTQGHIAEGSVSNIFFIKNNALYTPPIEDGCLPGVMRAHVLQTARTLGLNTHERSIGIGIIQTCNEAFLTNSLVGIRPVHQIDGLQIPDQVWTEKLRANL